MVFVDFPGDDLTSRKKVEKLSSGGVCREALNCLAPDFYSLLDRKALAYTRDDDGRSAVDWHGLKLGILRQKYEIFFGQAFADVRIGKPSFSKDDDMLGLNPRSPQMVVERERKVLIEENFQTTCWTAGGRWAATWAT